MTTSVGCAHVWGCTTVITRPRRSHRHLPLTHRDITSLPLPKTPPTIAAALQSSPGRVWTPVLVRDHAEARLRDFCISFSGLLVFSLPGLCVRVVLVCVCLCGCLCVGVCVSVPGPLRSLLRVCVARAVAAASWGGRPALFSGSLSCWSLWGLARVGFPVRFLFFPGFPVSLQDTWGSDESATRPNFSSEVLQAESSASLACEG